MPERFPRLYLARHGETEWSLTGQHTGLTDIALTDRGEANARSLGGRLFGCQFAKVLTSPLQRAKRTCELAGYLDSAEICEDAVEWNYGSYEGRRTRDIRAEERPGWYLFRDGCPDGEMPEEVGERADRVIDKVREVDGDVVLFSHGHFLRVLAARWMDLPANEARRLLLTTASLSVLSYEHGLDQPAVLLWNDDRHVTG
ncbi:MAG: histidine phosphatase family protein [Verrucomicrobiota bacterium]